MSELALLNKNEKQMYYVITKEFSDALERQYGLKYYYLLQHYNYFRNNQSILLITNEILQNDIGVDSLQHREKLMLCFQQFEI